MCVLCEGSVLLFLVGTGQSPLKSATASRMCCVFMKETSCELVFVRQERSLSNTYGFR